jgi:predicted DNA-binding transcriptional regulator YafY
VQTIIVIEDDAAARLHKAVRKAQPVTVTYVKADGEETVRTIEPTSLSLTKAGDVIVKAADRKSGEKRSFRLDRVRTYTTHQTAFTVRTEAPAPSKAELVQAFQARTYTVEYRNPARSERTLFETDSLDEAVDAKAVAQQDEHLELIHASF